MSEAHSDTFDLKDLYEEDIDPDPESGADRAKRFLEMNVVAPARIAADDWRALPILRSWVNIRPRNWQHCLLPNLGQLFRLRRTFAAC